MQNCSLLVALAPLGGIYHIIWSLDIWTNMGHRDALILFTGALRALPQILLHIVKRHLPTTIDADVLTRTNFLSNFCFLCQFNHLMDL